MAFLSIVITLKKCFTFSATKCVQYSLICLPYLFFLPELDMCPLVRCDSMETCVMGECKCKEHYKRENDTQKCVRK